ncbi:MAG: type II toxin-antitoxin system HigB family toxin [Alphaproteobacteria bacterium]|nr:type II toxin-antitoxin system HigB family toxin [Alphaproteobacteria bacterium]
MIVIRRDIVERYLARRAGTSGIAVARSSYDTWLKIAESAAWRTPIDVQRSHPKASILKGGRTVFNIKGNDFRLVARINYRAGTLEIRFFGTHGDYDGIDAETI